MEYEKHIKRLVLGYLKDVCKPAYKAFFKTNFEPRQRHNMSTRVGGQNLEEILTIYSKIQDIIQGRLEETNYYKEYSTEASSTYLVEQLFYLLEKNSSPTSPAPSERSLFSENQLQSDLDTTTTPECSLPGNFVNNEESHYAKSPFRKPKTPYLKKLPSAEHREISTVMTKKILGNKEFYNNLAKNITNALQTTPESAADSNNRRLNKEIDQENLDIDMEDLIVQDALSKTESDPLFNDLLNDILGPVGDKISKAIAADNAAAAGRTISTSSTEVEIIHEAENVAESSTAPKMNQITVVPSQPQPLYILNSPFVLSQPLKLLQTIPQSQLTVDTENNAKITEQDIMSMPTIILNEKNEISYAADANNLVVPASRNEVQNLKEYFNVYGATEQSPVVVKKKLPPKNKIRKVVATPTIKVEIFHRGGGGGGNFTQSPPVLSIREEEEGASKVSTPVVENVEKPVPKSLEPITTTPVEIPGKKRTPRSSSHVRNLSFPSPLQKNPANAGNVANKENATKDLFNGKERKKLIKPNNNAAAEWDSNIRKNLIIPEETKNDPVPPPPLPRRTPARRAKKKSSVVKNAKRKTAKTGKTAQKNENAAKVSNASEIVHESIPKDSIAKKNITNLLDTPMKEKKSEENSSTGGNLFSQFTPMLKANLEGIVVGDNFDIDTPDFPVTPGLNLTMETTTTNYCILNDTETNKATEAIILNEERKSTSVRKTEDDEAAEAAATAEICPKVYGLKNDLENFNRNRIGKKNLHLLDNQGLSWESNDKDYNNSEEDDDDDDTLTAINNSIKSAALNNEENAKKDAVAAPSINNEEKSKEAKKDEVAASSSSSSSSSASLSAMEVIKETLKSTQKISSSILINNATLKNYREEIEEVRNRAIEDLNKEQKKSAKFNNNTKRKNLPPKKIFKNAATLDGFNTAPTTTSQDEFFKQSGTNLHRRKSGEFSSSNNNSMQKIEETFNEETLKKCKIQLQPKEITIVYKEENDDENKSANKKIYNLKLLEKIIRMDILLDDDTEQSVNIQTTPFQNLMEIEPEIKNLSTTINNNKKRKNRSDSLNSNNSSQAKRINSKLPNYFNEKNIEKVLTKLHGPSNEKI